MRDQAVGVPRDRVPQVHRLEDLPSHHAKKRLAGGPLDDGTHQIPAVARILVFRARLEEQRVARKDLQSLLDAVVVGAVVKLVASVVPDAGDVAGDLPGRDLVALLREGRDVFLDRRVEVDPVVLDECAARR